LKVADTSTFSNTGAVYDFGTAVIPEPSSVMLVSIAGSLAMLRRRRRGVA
jgi:PEP-CTERM motif